MNAVFSDRVRAATPATAQAEPSHRSRAEVAATPAPCAGDSGATRLPLPCRIFRERPWARVSTALIATGALMLMQPFSIELYGYSFVVLLGGVAGMTIAARLPR